MAPALLLLALEFHRVPIRFRHLTDPRNPLPEAFGDWLVEACAAVAPARISGTAESLGTRTEALREAFLFLLRQVLLTPRADHYRVLGLSRNCTSEAVKQHHSLLVRMFHPDRLPEGDERGVVLTARINAACQVLRDPKTRERYDQGLPALRRGGVAQGAALEFFRAREPVEPLVWRPDPQPPVRGRRWRRPLLRWLLAGVPIAALVLFLLEEPGSPILRVDPDRADRASPVPSYLRGPEGGGPTDVLATRPPAPSAARTTSDTTVSDSPPAEAAFRSAGQVRSVMPRPEAFRDKNTEPTAQSPSGAPEDPRGQSLPQGLPLIDRSVMPGPAPVGRPSPEDALLTHRFPWS